jgi:hypothetical protein
MGVRPITIVIPDKPETVHPPALKGIGKETFSFYETVFLIQKTVSFYSICWRT